MQTAGGPDPSRQNAATAGFAAWVKGKST
jgi:hypothetical protein